MWLYYNFREMRTVSTERTLRAVSCFSRVSSSKACMMGERQSCEERECGGGERRIAARGSEEKRTTRRPLNG